MRAFVIAANRHFPSDPGKRDVRLRAPKLLRRVLGDGDFSGHGRGGGEHAMSADEIVALANGGARQAHCLGVHLELEELAIHLFACIRKQYKPAETFAASHFANEFWIQGNELYPRSHKRAITLAMQEAVEWVVHEGLIMRDPEQSGSYYLLTRRGLALVAPNSIADL